MYIKNHRFPRSLTNVINEQVQKMRNEDIIEPLLNSYNAPLLLVSKKNAEDKKKKWRLIVDFRKLNDRIDYQ